MIHYTTIEQSKVLSNVLPLESADMWWAWYSNPLSNGHYDDFPMFYKPICNPNESIPCWSLSALLKYLSEIEPQVYTPILFPSEGRWILQFVEYGHGIVCVVNCNNPIDACYETIIRLKEIKLL